MLYPPVHNLQQETGNLQLKKSLHDLNIPFDQFLRSVNEFYFRKPNKNGGVHQFAFVFAIPAELRVVGWEIVLLKNGFPPAGKDLKGIDFGYAIAACEDIEEVVGTIAVWRKGIGYIDVEVFANEQ